MTVPRRVTRSIKSRVAAFCSASVGPGQVQVEREQRELRRRGEHEMPGIAASAAAASSANARFSAMRGTISAPPRRA